MAAGDVLAEEAARADAQGAGHVLVALERGEDEDAAVPQLGVGADRGGRGEAVGAGHPDVHENDVRVMDPREVDGFGTVGRLRDHLQVVTGVDQDTEGRPEKGLVVGEQYTDGHEDLPDVRRGWGAGR